MPSKSLPYNATETPLSDILTRDIELQSHLRSLGLTSLDEYLSWCARHGFGIRLDKHWHERCRERYFAQQAVIKRRISGKRQEKRHPRRIIDAIFRGDVDQELLTQPHLHLLQRIADGIEHQVKRDALRQLLAAVDPRGGFFTNEPACQQFCAADTNTFISGLAVLAHHCGTWIRPLKAWRARSHNARRQFSSLARHLLAKFPVPSFMDSVWFLGLTADGIRQQAWYMTLADGASPRSLDLPIALNRRMAHAFLNAPRDYCVRRAVRWAQVVGLGGDGRLAKVVLGSRIGTNFDHNEFWQSVIRWLLHYPMLDPAQIGPLIDYIYRRKFEADGESDFSMKGRRPATLIRQMREWHAALRTGPEKPQLEWEQSGIGPFEQTEGALASDNLRRWTIVELRSRKELHHEGRAMRHCVASYDNSCALGGTSIWSMGLERNLGRRKRVLTIELATAPRRICQIRGKANRLPNQKEMNIVRVWASQQNLTLAEYLRT